MTENWTNCTIYFGAIIGHLNDGTKTTTAAMPFATIRAHSLEEARDIALSAAQQEWPSAGGWTHSVVMDQVPDWMLEEVIRHRGPGLI